ncbi:hypothetical protein UCD39_13875 [Nitrospirillum sp. BR 11752]|nr:hypothetical protein [Nitrospirillum sp. BR 11752]
MVMTSTQTMTSLGAPTSMPSARANPLLSRLSTKWNRPVFTTHRRVTL